MSCWCASIFWNLDESWSAWLLSCPQKLWDDNLELLDYSQRSGPNHEEENHRSHNHIIGNNCSPCHIQSGSTPVLELFLGAFSRKLSTAEEATEMPKRMPSILLTSPCSARLNLESSMNPNTLHTFNPDRSFRSPVLTYSNLQVRWHPYTHLTEFPKVLKVYL